MYVFTEPTTKHVDGFSISYDELPVNADSYYWLSPDRKVGTRNVLPKKFAGRVLIAMHGFKGVMTTVEHNRSGGVLKYIDGCSDTMLIAPWRRGDPSVHYLQVPAGTEQSFHTHPDLRVGLVIAGEGRCDLDGGEWLALKAGDAFVIHANEVHRFKTEGSQLEIFTWHPSTEYGPTDEDHPMKNGTFPV